MIEGTSRPRRGRGRAARAARRDPPGLAHARPVRHHRLPQPARRGVAGRRPDRDDHRPRRRARPHARAPRRRRRVPDQGRRPGRARPPGPPPARGRHAPPSAEPRAPAQRRARSPISCSAMPEPIVPDHQRLAAMRRSYERGGLEEGDLAPTWRAMLDRWLDDAVAGGVREPNAMVVATADARRAPERPDGPAQGPRRRRPDVLHQLRVAPRAASWRPTRYASILFPWHDLQRQVRLTGAVAKLDAAASDAYFASRPYGSRIGALAVAAVRGRPGPRRAGDGARRAAGAVPGPAGRRAAPGALGRLRRRARRGRVLAGPPGPPPRPPASTGATADGSWSTARLAP